MSPVTRFILVVICLCADLVWFAPAFAGPSGQAAGQRLLPSSIRSDVAKRRSVCTRSMARAGLCKVRPSSSAPALRQPALPGGCPTGQMRVGKRCVGPTAAPPVRPVAPAVRCIGGSAMGSGCLCPGGGVARQIGNNLYSCGTPVDCVGGRRIGGVCVRP